MADSPTDGHKPPKRSRDEVVGRADNRLVLAVVGTVLALLAAAVAVFGALVSRMVWRPGSIAVPWGLVLAVVASVVVVLVGRLYDRRLGLVAAGAWIVTTGLILAGRPEGDYVFAQDGLGLGYLLLSAIAVISAAAAGGPAR